MSKGNYKNVEEKMYKTINVLKDELISIRVGRANPSVLDRILVDYYGVPTPINQLGNISIPEARVLIIQPWEAKIIKDIEKAIQKSDLGINPNSDGKIIRLAFPAPTEERRKELVKQVKKTGEDAKIALRTIRRDAMEEYKAKKKISEITEDDLKVIEKDIQNLTDKHVAEIDRLVELKDKEILEV